MVDVEAADRLIGLSTDYTDYTDCALLAGRPSAGLTHSQSDAASNRSWNAPTDP